MVFNGMERLVVDLHRWEILYVIVNVVGVSSNWS